MLLRDVTYLAERYLVLGLLIAAVALLALLIGYFIVYKRLFSGKKKLKAGTVVLGGVFLCYIVVVIGATILQRHGVAYRNVELRPFYSYREAWREFSPRAWRLIILNIMMLVPFGLLLPMLWKRFQCFWKTYLAGLGFTVLIELMQLVLERGFFETDDLINNLLGAMIGYGIYALFKRGKKSHTLYLQIPLVVTIATFVMIFTVYQKRELGNLSFAYINKVPASKLTVNSNESYSKEESQVPIYQLQYISKEEAKGRAESLFKWLGLGLDEERTEYYDETGTFYSEDGSRSLWIDYAGSSYWYTDFNESFGEEGEVAALKRNATEKEIREAVEAFGFYLPEEAVFMNEGEGRYSLRCNMLVIEDTLYDGELTCSYNENGKLTDFFNRIIAYQPYKEVSAISQQEAYEQVCDGKFENETKTPVNVELGTCELVYKTDSKGFYQPIQVFQATINGEEDIILIPAIKK